MSDTISVSKGSLISAIASALESANGFKYERSFYERKAVSLVKQLEEKPHA
jgi:hypothetical protein